MKNRLLRRRPKRTTFWKLFAKAMTAVIVITLLLAAVLNYGIEYFLCRQAFSQQSSLEDQLSTSVQYKEDKYDKIGGRLNIASFQMGMGTYYVNTYGFEESFTVPFLGHIASDSDREGIAVSALIDGNGNVMISNAAKIWCIMKTDNDPSNNKWLFYDPEDTDLPELRQLIDYALDVRYSEHRMLSFDILSAYVDISGHRIIPHTVRVYYKKSDKRYADLNEVIFDDEVIALYKDTEVNTEGIDLGGYEFMDFQGNKKYGNDGPETYPSCGFENVWGVEKEKVEKTLSERYKSGGPDYEDQFDNTIKNGNARYLTVTYNDEKCTLFTYFKVFVWNKSVKRMYIILTGLVFLIMTFIAFLRCWAKNTRNQAQYAFEDYQRALTNNLAHDIKTPLAVIGGYAENLIEMRKEGGSEKELKYLSSIMKNVAYTDDIIAKTLELSETEQIKNPNKTKVDIKALAEKLAEKYTTALEEKSIELTVEGGGEVSADEDMLSVAVENLISNAVKYTREGGSIKITADRKRLSVVNDTAENVDTKDLLIPFVKGDKGRSDKNSHGLGLAIAAAAAERNGFRLNVDCRDRKFTAVIEF